MTIRPHKAIKKIFIYSQLALSLHPNAIVKSTLYCNLQNMLLKKLSKIKVKIIYKEKIRQKLKLST